MNVLVPKTGNRIDDWFAKIGGKEFPLPKIADTYAGRLIVCADGACVWDDLEKLGCRREVGRGSVHSAEPAHFMVVNKLGETFPGDIEHWYSNEGNLLQHFVSARRNEYRREFNGPMHTHSCNRGAKWHWPWRGWGTSGLNAILTGLGLGYDEIILCGMPLDNSHHNGEPPWRKANFLSEVSDQINGQINQHWRMCIRDVFDGRVRSMSGRTAEWLRSSKPA